MDRVAQLMALADNAPAHLAGTARTIKVAASALRRGLQSSEALAHTLRTYAHDHRATAARLPSMAAVALQFMVMASLLETAASILHHEHVQEAAR